MDSNERLDARIELIVGPVVAFEDFGIAGDAIPAAREYRDRELVSAQLGGQQDVRDLALLKHKDLPDCLPAVTP